MKLNEINKILLCEEIGIEEATVPTLFACQASNRETRADRLLNARASQRTKPTREERQLSRH